MTIISIPMSYSFGPVFIGNTKHKFPLCIVNPLKKNKLNNDIKDYINEQIDLFSSQNSSQEIKVIKIKKLFTDESGNVVSFNIKSIDMESDIYYLLIEREDNINYQCLVLMDTQNKKVFNILF